MTRGGHGGRRGTRLRRFWDGKGRATEEGYIKVLSFLLFYNKLWNTMKELSID